MLKKWSLALMVLFAMSASVAFAREETPWMNLSPDILPDISRAVPSEPIPLFVVHHSTSGDGFVVDYRVQWGMATVWEESIVTTNLLGSDTVILYGWKVGDEGEWRTAFADGTIYPTGFYAVDVLAIKLFENRIRITIYDADGNKQLESREFTVIGNKPAPAETSKRFELPSPTEGLPFTISPPEPMTERP